VKRAVQRNDAAECGRRFILKAWLSPGHRHPAPRRRLACLTMTQAGPSLSRSHHAASGVRDVVIGTALCPAAVLAVTRSLAGAVSRHMRGGSSPAGVRNLTMGCPLACKRVYQSAGRSVVADRAVILADAVERHRGQGELVGQLAISSTTPPGYCDASVNTAHARFWRPSAPWPGPMSMISTPPATSWRYLSKVEVDHEQARWWRSHAI
jgi:hypothetical protein